MSSIKIIAREVNLEGKLKKSVYSTFFTSKYITRSFSDHDILIFTQKPVTIVAVFGFDTPLVSDLAIHTNGKFTLYIKSINIIPINLDH